MFVFLNKKIAIPNNESLSALSWSKSQGFIACGGERGLLKVLKLDPKNDGHVRGIAAQTTLTMNETLMEHQGTITNIIWNEQHDKMTTADENGIIIVWILCKNQWYQEMINNSNKSSVNGMKWNAEGDKICIVYEDGAVIVGSVDGSRHWGKTLPDKLSLVEWSPNSRLLLFGLLTGDVFIYDYGGNKLGALKNFCAQNDETNKKIEIIAIEWYNGENGYLCKGCPCLALCYSNGCCQIMKHENDEYPILINTGLEPKSVAWNGDGTILAIAGLLTAEEGGKDANLIQFYDCFGYHLRTLKIPAKQLHSCSWDGESLRIAVAVDSSIYFATIRPNYKWAYCYGDTIVFANLLPGKHNHYVNFWNVKSEKRYTKTFGKLRGIASSGSLCCIMCRSDSESSNKYTLQVCNSIGTPIDAVEVPFDPLYYTMLGSHVIVATTNVVYIWQFKKPENLLAIDSQLKKTRSEIYVHIDDTSEDSSKLEPKLNDCLQRETNDSICCLCATTGTLIVARESGVVHNYALPQLKLEGIYRLRNRPFKMEVNCNASRIAVIDFGGILTFYDLKSVGTGPGGDQKKCALINNFEFKDVWDMKFSEDNPYLFVMMEKAKLRMIENMEASEPLVFSGYICEYKDLEVKAILLDEVMQNYDELNSEYLVTLEAKILRDCRQFLEDGQLDKAQQLIEDNPHSKMWKLLAEYSLEKLDLDLAEQAFVRYSFYPGIKFVKKLQKIQNNTLKMAEVSFYFGRYDEAEKRFMSVDRPDLAIKMLKAIGEWQRVLSLLKKSESASDADMNEAWNAIGQEYFDKDNWSQAASYFTQGKCYEKLVECYYYLEDYNSLEKLADLLPEDSDLLKEIADIFMNAGMCQKAVYAYQKSNQLKKAIDCCIHLNNWQLAIELAKSKNMENISELLAKYSKQLLSNKCYMQAVKLYKSAGYYLDAAKIVQKMTEDEAKTSKDYMKLKKMSVIIGLLIEQHHEQSKVQARAKLKDVRGQEAASALDGMLQEEFVGISESKLLDRPWHWAEAFHYYLLAQRQLFQRYYNAAMRTACLLTEYEDVLSPRDIYSLITICALYNQAYGTCSKALSKLENLNTFTKKEKEALTQMTFKIFTKYTPTDPARVSEYEEIAISYDGESKIPICMVSGEHITLGQFWMCPVCKHSALEEEINKVQNCPLCHAAT